MVATRIAVGPALNIDDAPEASIGHVWPRRSSGRLTLAQRGARRTGARLVTHHSLNLVHEHSTLSAHTLEEQHGGDELAEAADEQPWACSACTFVNAGALPMCEMCATRRHQPAVPATQAEQLGQLPEDVASWPSLEKSADRNFALCEVSSAASTWQLVGDEDDACSTASFIVVGDPEYLSDGASDTAAAATVPSTPTPALATASWASRAGAGAGAVAFKPPAARVPPLGRKPRRAEASPTLEGDVIEDDLDELQAPSRHRSTLPCAAQLRRRERRCR